LDGFPKPDGIFDESNAPGESPTLSLEPIDEPALFLGEEYQMYYSV
jgi:hypothetical protein